jgi:hypothetical protein
MKFGIHAFAAASSAARSPGRQRDRLHGPQPARALWPSTFRPAALHPCCDIDKLCAQSPPTPPPLFTLHLPKLAAVGTLGFVS